MKECVLFTDEMNDMIKLCDKVKDLGILIDEEANFKPQLINAVKKAKAKSAKGLRTFMARSKIEIITL